jgi:hypothetical protein
MFDFENLDEYKRYWTEKLNNGDALNHSSAELMLEAVKDAETLEEAESEIYAAIELANSIVLNVWALDLRVAH